MGSSKSYSGSGMMPGAERTDDPGPGMAAKEVRKHMPEGSEKRMKYKNEEPDRDMKMSREKKMPEYGKKMPYEKGMKMKGYEK